jgi:hypothetical protein
LCDGRHHEYEEDNDNLNRDAERVTQNNYDEDNDRSNRYATSNRNNDYKEHNDNRSDNGSNHNSIPGVDGEQWRKQKAFKQILSSQAARFNGSDPTEYTTWKDSLHEDVQALDITATQWLQLLEARTGGFVRDIVARHSVIKKELGPTEALEAVWKSLNKRFRSQQKPAKQLLQDLMYGPSISKTKTEQLYAFAENCQCAVQLLYHHNRTLATLEDESTQQTITNRLEVEFRTEWLKERENHLDEQDNAPFSLSHNG